MVKSEMASLTFDPTQSAKRDGSRRRPAVSRPGPAPRPAVAEAATVVAWLGFGACIALAVTAGIGVLVYFIWYRPRRRREGDRAHQSAH